MHLYMELVSNEAWICTCNILLHPEEDGLPKELAPLPPTDGLQTLSTSYADLWCLENTTDM